MARTMNSGALRVAMIFGGWSSERAVSMSSAEKVRPYLADSRHSFIDVELTADHRWLVGAERVDANPVDFLSEIDAVFLLLHGVGGEDGVVQGLLESLGVPYTGPGVAPSAVFMDKILAKRQFLISLANTPRYTTVSDIGGFDGRSMDELWGIVSGWESARYVVKPSRHGSSLGVTIAKDRDGLRSGIKEAFRFDSDVLVEEFVEGVEVQVGVMGSASEFDLMPPLELVFNDGQDWFDPESKYGPDRTRVDFVVPARISHANLEYVRRVASKIYREYAFDGYARFDFIVPKIGLPHVLEVNTITGMTPTSTFPVMASHDGLSYSDLVDRLLDLAMARFGNKKRGDLPGRRRASANLSVKE